MKRFPGFPTKMQFTPLPNLFFTVLLPQIDDANELKATLHIFWAIYHKRGYPRFVTLTELVEDETLMNGLKRGDKPPAEALRYALEQATMRGTLLQLTLDSDGGENIYFLNTESDRMVVAKIRRGEFSLKGLIPKAKLSSDMQERPDIFTLYEQNIGMLTPMIAEELKEAERLYPSAWIESAIKEAVCLNKRNWRYIARILERWSLEGKEDGELRRDLKKDDPDKYIKGRYGHLVRR